MAKDAEKNIADVPHVRKEPRPDFSTPPPSKRLPTYLEETINDEEKWATTVADGTAGESTDSNVRYAAYANRIRTILVSAQRYVAYTSDIGESFRPVAHPYLVKGAYAVSWAYLAGDVSYEGYKAYLRNQRILHPEADQVTGTEVVSSDKPNSLVQPNQTALGPRIPAIEDYRAVMAQR